MGTTMIMMVGSFAIVTLIHYNNQQRAPHHTSILMLMTAMMALTGAVAVDTFGRINRRRSMVRI